MGSAGGGAERAHSEWKWSAAEKIVARRAFDAALQCELEIVIREVKERAGRIAELWELEGWLAEQRRRVDGLFDFRYSVLPVMFAALLRQGRLDEAQLRGLAEDKVEAILHIARM